MTNKETIEKADAETSFTVPEAGTTTHARILSIEEHSNDEMRIIISTPEKESTKPIENRLTDSRLQLLLAYTGEDPLTFEGIILHDIPVVYEENSWEIDYNRIRKEVGGEYCPEVWADERLVRLLAVWGGSLIAGVILYFAPVIGAILFLIITAVFLISEIPPIYRMVNGEYRWIRP